LSKPLVLVLLILNSLGALAQQTGDTLQIESKPLITAEEIKELEIPEDAWVPDPSKAAFYAAILPGAGQAYNRALWKVPLVYAGGATVVYFVKFFNGRYSESLRSFRQIELNSDITEINGNNSDFYRRNTEFYRRQRDYSIILGGLFYGITIVEAYVDAHLQTFRFTEDEFSMNVKPTLFAVGTQPALGMKISLQLK
jgi:hypothetical protein